MLVPPTVDAMRPMGTGSAPSLAAAILSESAFPKYQHTAEKRSGKWPTSAPRSSADCDALERGSVQVR